MVLIPKTAEKKAAENCFPSKIAITYVEATGEDCSPRKRTSSTSKNGIY
jgi:hypothetical protein